MAAAAVDKRGYLNRSAVSGLLRRPGDFLYSQAEQDRQKHVRQGIAEGQIGCHQETVKGKADGPDDQIPKIYFFGIMILNYSPLHDDCG
ncbi:hypothetical protein [Chordicoccus furentiruminis]|uniref:hypothetical protein n=1 Tax=Chordicoccus furentiruminis TaxID=2709410 RepID=UPI0023A8B9F9|nr:hypothetical protein [Chordicoccus furentiruminis]